MPFDTAGFLTTPTNDACDFGLLRVIRSVIASSCNAWVQGSMTDGHGGRCLVAWVEDVTPFTETRDRLMDRIVAQLPRRYRRKTWDASEMIIDFNDDDHTTRRNVLRLLNRVIERPSSQVSR